VSGQANGLKRVGREDERISCRLENVAGYTTDLDLVIYNHDGGHRYGALRGSGWCRRRGRRRTIGFVNPLVNLLARERQSWRFNPEEYRVHADSDVLEEAARMSGAEEVATPVSVDLVAQADVPGR